MPVWRSIKGNTEMELSDNRRDWLMAPTVEGRELGDGGIVSTTIQPPGLGPAKRGKVMEFVVVVLGLLIGRGWTWTFASGLSSLAGVAPPALTLILYVVIAVVTGIAISELERRAAFPSEIVHGAAVGFIAGFISHPWFVPQAARIYRRRQVKLAIAYLLLLPALTWSALLGGYLSCRPVLSLP